MKLSLLGRLRLSDFCGGGMLVWEQAPSLTGLNSKRHGLYVLFILPSGIHTHLNSVKRRKTSSTCCLGMGKIKIIAVFFVRAGVSAGEYLDNEDSTLQDHTYGVFFQNTACRSSAADLACEIVEDLLQ